MEQTRKETRRKLRDIELSDDFERLLDQCTLSETDKRLLRMHYLEQKDFRFIGDALGYSEKTMQQRHKTALRKLSAAL